MTFEELKNLEQNVLNNSDAFHSFLLDNHVNFKPNEHYTTIIGNVDLFWLGVSFGKYWAKHELK